MWSCLPTALRLEIPHGWQLNIFEHTTIALEYIKRERANQSAFGTLSDRPIYGWWSYFKMRIRNATFIYQQAYHLLGLHSLTFYILRTRSLSAGSESNRHTLENEAEWKVWFQMISRILNQDSNGVLEKRCAEMAHPFRKDKRICWRQSSNAIRFGPMIGTHSDTLRTGTQSPLHRCTW